MLTRTIVPAFKGALSLHQALELSSVYLEGAFKTTDHDIALLLCGNAEAALSHARNADKKFPEHLKNARYEKWRSEIAAAFIDLSKLLQFQGYGDEAELMCKKTVKWGGTIHDHGRLAQSSIPGFIMRSSKGLDASAGDCQDVGSANPLVKKRPVVATISSNIFPKNIQPPSIDVKLPDPDERLINTPQLACCLGLLQVVNSPSDILQPRAHNWLQIVEKDVDEQERLHAMAIDVVRAFKRDEIKDARVISEVVYLAPVLTKDPFRDLLRDFHSAVEQSTLLDTHRVEGLAQLIQGADSGYLDADDLIKILELLSTRLKTTHQQSSNHMRQLTLAVSHVLDAMAETQVKGVDHKKIHEPIMEYLDGLRKSSDPFLVYQAAYAYQALLCVPDNEKLWQAALRRTGRIVKGIAGLVNAVKSVDLDKLIEGLDNIQKGLAGASKVADIAFTAYKDVKELAKSGQGFLQSLKEGVSFKRPSAWYPALRGADTLIQRGELAAFRRLVCEAPCRYNAAFQWGVCQRLGEMAANPMWDAVTRRSAISFLGEIYQNDDMWGQHVNVKQLILNILMQLVSSNPGSSPSSESSVQLHAIVAGKLLQDLEVCDDIKKQDLYRECRRTGPIDYPMKISLPELASPSLLDRVQNRPDVEGNVRMLRKQRTKGHGIAVYVQPQAKENTSDPDDKRFHLMEKIVEFLSNERKVFLVLGDSGAGKSTFSRELEFQLWQSYVKKTGRIPLHINLPTIEKPEHDMIAKQLRKHEFTEPQIREMKHYRKFILICDGYDESQLTHNLYMSNKLNQPEGWDAQMVISCRTEYLGSDYRDRFQPGDRNTHLDSTLFQEAVVAPFSLDQVNAYIEQYVLTQQPLWRIQDYEQALKLIPNLKDLVQNPFLMALSLEVLPRMVDPGQHLSTTRVTRVGLYDHFVEQWLERNKKRLGEKDLNPQARAAFERLSAEGFRLNGIEYLKKLAVAVYKEQDGHPVVNYSQLVDEGSWKDALFKETHKQLLLEACPLTRNGNQHRFIHRSILEYALARAVFDPQDIRNQAASEPLMALPRSVNSAPDDESYNYAGNDPSPVKGPDFSSPLMWRNFVSDYSILQFLEERVRREPVFKEQLMSYIERSKDSKKWRTAAANAITMLVRTGIPFSGADLRGIQIPSADLSYGMFDQANLQDANLWDVNLRGISLRKADLTGSIMSRVQFGELPSLSENDKVVCCTYSPDGTTFVVGLYSGDISVYTTFNWEKILTLQGHTKYVRRVSISTAGCQIASAGGDKTVRLWDVDSKICQRVLEHDNEVNCVAYSPKGDKIVSACDGKLVHLWASDTGERLQTLCGHSDVVECVAFSPIGNEVISGSKDCTIRIWETESGTCSHILLGHKDEVRAIAYSPRGDRFATGSYDKTVRLWDARTRACRHVLNGHNDAITSVAYSPKGDQVVSGSADQTLRLWDTETGAHRHAFVGHGKIVQCVAFSIRGDQIASGSDDRTVRLWDVSAVASHNISGGHSNHLYDVSCLPQGHLIASASRDNTIRLWDVETVSCCQTLRGHTDTVSGVAFSPMAKANMIVSGSFDKSVRLWDVKSETCRVWSGHKGPVYGVAFSPQGNLIASCSKDETVRLWDLSTGDCFGTLSGHSGSVLCVTFSPDGNLIASGGKNRKVYVWDVETSNYRHILEDHTNEVWGVAFSPDGKQLASAGNDATIRLWSVKTGNREFVLTGHARCVSSIAYSFKGDILASGSFDKTVRLWDFASGKSRAVIQNFQGTIRGVSWRSVSNGNFLVTGEESGSILMWKVTEDEGKCYVKLQWSTSKGQLNLTGATVQGVRGLSQLNKELLKQRKAIGEPESKLKQPLNEVVPETPSEVKSSQPTGRWF